MTTRTKTKALTAEQLLAVIKRRKIQLTPVLGRRGQIDWWSAGFRSVNRKSGLNYVGATRFAEGKTPEEAISKLLVGRTAHKMVHGRLTRVER